MTEKEVMEKAQGLAKRYYSVDDKSELASEAILAYYEAVAKGETDEDALVTVMRKAMFNFVNFRNRTIPVPSRGGNYKLAKVMDQERYDKLSTGEKMIYDALRQGFDLVEETQVSTEGPYDQETLLSLRKAFSRLTDPQKQVIHQLYVVGETQETAAVKLNVSQSHVNKVKRQALDKLRASL